MTRVCIYQGTTPADAYLVRDWLERNAVATELRGESLMGLHGQVPIGDFYPSIWVAPHLEMQALALVREFLGPSLVHPEWMCPACDEPNAANFGSCWSCGADRPGLADEAD